MPDAALPHRELVLHAQRVSDRWPIERAHVGAGELHIVVVVSTAFDGARWLERIQQGEALWDVAATRPRGEVHCYTPVELRAQARGPSPRACGGRIRGRRAVSA